MFFVGDDMEYNLLRLKNDLERFIPIEEEYSFSKEQLKGTDVISLDDMKVVGEITKDAIDNIYLNVDVSGTLVLPCAITLKPVDYPFNIKIEGNIDELVEENEKSVKKDENTLDILPIIWENILMEIPMRVVSEDAEEELSNLEGNGWKVITEEDDGEINPELAKLKDLL
mgnify:FL=1